MLPGAFLYSRERDVFRALDQGFLDADRAKAFYDEGLFLNERIHYTLDFGFHSYTCSICGHLQQQKEKENAPGMAVPDASFARLAVLELAIQPFADAAANYSCHDSKHKVVE